MEQIIIGIPILNRIDLLLECIGALDYPAHIVVINNNVSDTDFLSRLDKLSVEGGVKVLHQSRNLGVSASWNLIIKTALSLGFHKVFIGSNDTILSPGSLKASLSFQAGNPAGIWHLHAFNFFAITRVAVEKAGYFDENFYPAYKEDQDYSYRCGLAGVKRIAGIPGCHAKHYGSATINSDPHYANLNSRTHSLNVEYYCNKWGGDSGNEMFKRPFNEMHNAIGWWPKSQLICNRDWDKIPRSDKS